MWTRVELKTRAKELLTLNYWKAVLVSLIFAFVGGSGSGSGGSSSSTSSSSGDSSSFSGLSSEELSMILGISAVVVIIILLIILVSLALSYFVFTPLLVGCQRFFVQCDNGQSSFDDVAFVFSNSYLNVVKIMFFRSLYTFLWTLLVIIPGIIKAYEYRMIPYILAENPSISKQDAFALSKKMMDGNKLDAWVLDLSFIGWDILCVFTFGIGNLCMFHFKHLLCRTLQKSYQCTALSCIKKSLFQ